MGESKNNLGSLAICAVMQRCLVTPQSCSDYFDKLPHAMPPPGATAA